MDAHHAPIPPRLPGCASCQGSAPHPPPPSLPACHAVRSAGIYYPPGTLKARLCVEGRQLLYAFCEAHGVAHARLGKLLVATSQAQLPALAALEAAAVAAGVPDLVRLRPGEAAALEPAVRCVGALLSPSTGVVDSHGLMVELLRQAEEAGATLALHSRVVRGSLGGSSLGGSSSSSGGGGRGGPARGGAAPLHRLVVADAASGEETALTTRLLVSAAGLWAQEVSASLAGLPPASIPPQWLAKGCYYGLASGRSPFSHLVYPMPEPGAAGLGVHLTLDLAGQSRFGPDVEWLPQVLGLAVLGCWLALAGV